jgi:hypothetical protein
MKSVLRPPASANSTRSLCRANFPFADHARSVAAGRLTPSFVLSPTSAWLCVAFTYVPIPPFRSGRPAPSTTDDQFIGEGSASMAKRASAA